MHMYFSDVFILFLGYIVLYSCTLFLIFFTCVPFLGALSVSIMLYIYSYSGVENQRAANRSSLNFGYIDILDQVTYRLHIRSPFVTENKIFLSFGQIIHIQFLNN